MCRSCDLDKLLGCGSGVFGGHGATGLERGQDGPHAHQHGGGWGGETSQGHERAQAQGGAPFLTFHFHFLMFSSGPENMHSERTIQKHPKNKQEECYCGIAGSLGHPWCSLLILEPCMEAALSGAVP